MEPIKLVVLDDHNIVIDGIRAMLIGNAQIKLIGDANDMPSLLKQLEKELPDILITDIKLGGNMTGIEIAALVKKDFPSLKILMLSGNTEDHYVLSAIKAGATGFLSKDSRKDEFVAAVHSVYMGQTYFGENISQVIIDQYVRQSVQHIQDPDKPLSDREMEIVQWLCDGITTREIGEKLFISSRTVESHKNNILQKLGLKNTIELVKYAIRKNWIAS
ncbi:MAG: response regulator transcription factor [Chitinophagaceae bacterium]|nr:response regulator transcription factor [Chitinophagaceae bacterium]